MAYPNRSPTRWLGDAYDVDRWFHIRFYYPNRSVQPSRLSKPSIDTDTGFNGFDMMMMPFWGHGDGITVSQNGVLDALQWEQAPRTLSPTRGTTAYFVIRRTMYSPIWAIRSSLVPRYPKPKLLSYSPNREYRMVAGADPLDSTMPEHSYRTSTIPCARIFLCTSFLSHGLVAPVPMPHTALRLVWLLSAWCVDF